MKNVFSKMVSSALWGAVVLSSVVALSGCKESDEPKPVPKGMADAPASETTEEEVPVKSSLNAKTRYVAGNVDLQKKLKDWKKLQVGNKVVENDKIRTGQESEADLGMPDGSILKISEKTEAMFSVEERDGKKKMILVDITKGRIHFDIQKQKDREFKFKTGTATAASRGTSGFVGNVNGKTVASLKEGKIEVTGASGKTSAIAKNQTVLVDDKGNATVLKLASSGTEALSKVVDSVAAADAPAKTLENTLKTFDAAYATALKAFESKLQFRATPVGDTLFVPSVTLTARVTPGIWVTVWGERDSIGANGIYQRTFTWADSAYGTKRFLASCGDGHIEMPCYMWVAEYAAVSANDEDAAKPSDNANVSGSIEKLTVKVSGPRSERVHLDLPATEWKSNLKFSLNGISKGDLRQVASISVLRNGKPFKTIDANDLTSLAYEVPVSIARNKIADFEVVATLKNGKRYRAKKTFEVYCLVSNHPGGKARNSVVPPDQEYTRLKQSGGLSHE